jgi:small subunit ribosomal protein S9
MADISFNATGRRKTSVARVTLTPGTGTIKINRRGFEQYFPRAVLRMMIRQPLELTGTIGKFDINALIDGGGPTGQAGALRHGISRALIRVNSDLRPMLKKEGFLTRDPREKERQKYGQKGARARFQFSKR